MWTHKSFSVSQQQVFSRLLLTAVCQSLVPLNLLSCLCQTHLSSAPLTLESLLLEGGRWLLLPGLTLDTHTLRNWFIPEKASTFLLIIIFFLLYHICINRLSLVDAFFFLCPSLCCLLHNNLTPHCSSSTASRQGLLHVPAITLSPDCHHTAGGGFFLSSLQISG